MARTRLLAVSASAILLTACQYIPGTGAYEEAKAREAVSATLVDPSSAQFRNLASREGVVCGEVNGKNRMGAYAGFVRFYVETANWTAVTDPLFDPQSLASARSLCALARYDTSACARQIEEELKQSQQLAFNASWDVRCGAARVPQTHTPFDPTRSENLADLDLVAENAALTAPASADNSQSLQTDTTPLPADMRPGPRDSPVVNSVREAIEAAEDD